MTSIPDWFEVCTNNAQPLLQPIKKELHEYLEKYHGKVKICTDKNL